MKDIDDEFPVKRAADHILSSLPDCASDTRFEQTQLCIGRGGARLDDSESLNEFTRKSDSADGEIFNGTLRLRAVISVLRHFDFAHRVPLATKVLVNHWTSDRRRLCDTGPKLRRQIEPSTGTAKAKQFCLPLLAALSAETLRR